VAGPHRAGSPGGAAEKNARDLDEVPERCARLESYSQRNMSEVAGVDLEGAAEPAEESVAVAVATTDAHVNEPVHLRRKGG